MTASENQPAPALIITDNRVMADSRDVAESFEKEHKNVLQAIRNLECSNEFKGLNFQPFKIKDLTGESTSHVLMTRDGFVFLVMGFTGSKAAAWKERYIGAFNTMEARLLDGPAKATAELDDFKRARETRLQMNGFLRLAKSMGLEGNQAVIAANQATRIAVGFDVLEAMGVTHLAAPQNEALLTPTEVADRMDLPSARRVNALLIAYGFQETYRDAKGALVYEPTEKGRRAGAVMMDTGKRHSNGAPVRQLKWASGVVEALGAELAESAA